MKISCIIPVLNEEENIYPIYEHLRDIFREINYNYEIIFVLDGCSDHSDEFISNIIYEDKNVKSIIFTRNFGHMAALIAGFKYCTGDAAITLDCDMQHPPELIPELIRRWQDGNLIVNTKRVDKNQKSFIKKITSKYFYWIFSWLSEMPIESGNADFRLIDRIIIDQINQLEEHDIFLRGMIYWLGFNFSSIEYTPNKRRYGEPKYDIGKSLRFAIMGITSFSIKPLKMVTIIGFIISAFTFFYLVYTIYSALILKIVVSGWASLMICVLFLGGIQLISIGVLGEYIGKILIETKKRPRYIIHHFKGFEI